MIELTIEELKDRLKRYDEVTLLELLDISAEDIIERFADVIEDRYDLLIKEED
jgi:hypothetical protein